MAAVAAQRLPDSLLKHLLVYALHADQDLDVEDIHGHLSANSDLQKQAVSVAEKLRAEGRREGLEQGRQEGCQEGRIEGLIGQIQLREEFPGRSFSARERAGKGTASAVARELCDCRSRRAAPPRDP